MHATTLVVRKGGQHQKALDRLGIPADQVEAERRRCYAWAEGVTG